MLQPPNQPRVGKEGMVHLVVNPHWNQYVDNDAPSKGWRENVSKFQCLELSTRLRVCNYSLVRFSIYANGAKSQKSPTLSLSLEREAQLSADDRVVIKLEWPLRATTSIPCMTQTADSPSHPIIHVQCGQPTIVFVSECVSFKPLWLMTSLVRGLNLNEFDVGIISHLLQNLLINPHKRGSVTRLNEWSLRMTIYGVGEVSNDVDELHEDCFLLTRGWKKKRGKDQLSPTKWSESERLLSSGPERDGKQPKLMSGTNVCPMNHKIELHGCILHNISKKRRIVALH